MLPFLVPFVAAAYTYSLSVGGPYDGNALGSAIAVWGVWLLAALAGAATVLLANRLGRLWVLAAVPTGALTVLAGAYTFDETLNDAPDGSGHSVTFREAAGEAATDVETALDLVLGDRWSHGQFTPSTLECVDWFGRSRGAVRGSAYWDLDRRMTADEATELKRRLQKPGRRVTIVEPLKGPYFDAAHDFVFEVDIGDDAASGRIAIHLPCLRP